MSVSSIASTSSLYQPVSSPSNSSQKNISNSFQQMADAIQSGDLDGAQNAYDSLAQLLSANQPSTQSSGSSTDPSASGSDTNSFASLISQIGGELQSGDLSGAQQTLQALQQTQTTQGHHHRHHHGGGSATSQASQASQTDPTAGTAASAGDPTSTSAGVNLTV